MEESIESQFNALLASKLTPAERLDALRNLVVNGDLDAVPPLSVESKPKAGRPVVHNTLHPAGKGRLVKKPSLSGRLERGGALGKAGPASSSPQSQAPTPCSLRGKIWKVLLGVVQVDAEEYIKLVQLGPSLRHELILIDLKRTFKNDATFQANVSQAKLIRVLNAFDHWCIIHRGATVHPIAASSTASDGAAPSSHSAVSASKYDVPPPSGPAQYCQGIDLLAAVLLYVLPEVDAFASLLKLCDMFPLHFTGAATGAHMLCSLVDACLSAHDPELRAHLVAGFPALPAPSHGGAGDSDGDAGTSPSSAPSVRSLHTTPPVYCVLFAFPRLFSVYACVPPLVRLLRIWDVMFATGPALLVPLVVADIELRRDVLLAETRNAVAVLERSKGQPIDVDRVIEVALQIRAELPVALQSAIAECPAVKAPVIDFCGSPVAAKAPPAPAAKKLTTRSGVPLPTASRRPSSAGRRPAANSKPLPKPAVPPPAPPPKKQPVSVYSTPLGVNPEAKSLLAVPVVKISLAPMRNAQGKVITAGGGPVKVARKPVVSSASSLSQRPPFVF